jgi:folate-binding protein YgfZ
MSEKNLELSAAHERLGASWTAWRGWRVPEHYGDPAAEYRAAREAAAISDESHAGRILISGPDALDFLHRLSTASIVDLEPARAVPTCLTNEKGRVLDLVLALRTEEGVLLLAGTGSEEVLSAWLGKYHVMEDLEIRSGPPGCGVLDLEGPGSRKLLSEVLDGPPPASPEFFTLHEGTSGETPLRLLRLPGADREAWRLLVPQEAMVDVWEALLRVGARALGLRAREALRIESGWPAYGRELGGRYNPLELGLRGAVDFEKGCYIGQEVVARLDTYRKVGRRRVGIEASGLQEVHDEGRPVPLLVGEQKIGELTSLAPVPGADRSVGQGVVRGERFEEGADCAARIGEKEIRATMKELPLVV